MKALSIIQPWASLIVLGYKPVENRTWPTRYRGRLLIHASKRGDDPSAELLCQQLLIELPRDLPRGMILGAVDLVDCVELSPATPIEQLDLGPWAFGPWCWLLENVMRFETPIACRGSLGLWTPPAGLLEVGGQSGGLPADEPGRHSGNSRSDDQRRLF